MEPQQVFVCSADVAAFVDALETIGFGPMVETQIVSAPTNADERDVEAEEQACGGTTYVIENGSLMDQSRSQMPSKRFRLNAKEFKDVMEKLFEEQKAVVTEKAFMNVKGNKRFKSDVWSWFGDVKLLISRSEAKSLNIPYYFRQCGNERMMLSKLFVACFKCNALFIHDAQRSGTSTLRAHMRVCSRPRPRKKKGSPTIIFFQSQKKASVANNRSIPDVEKVTAPDQVLNFLLSTQNSFDVVEDPQFVKLVETCMSIGSVYGDINIESMLCPQEKLSDFLMHDLYMSSVNAFYTEFQYSYGASFSINIWADEHNKNQYVSLLCHYVTNSGELKKVAIYTEEFDADRKTSEDVRDWFHGHLSEMAVVPLKRLIISDSLSRCSAAFKDEEHVNCSYQCMNMVLENLIETALSEQNEHLDFTSLLTGCNDIVCYFDQVKDHYSLPQQLKSYTKDSWSSIVSMLRSIHNQYEDILNILNETREIHLFSVDKAIIAAVIEFFSFFEDAIKELTSSQNPSINILIPWITKLRKYCSKLDNNFLVVQQLKKMVMFEINSKLASNVSIYHRIATLLDPRFKRLMFLPREDQIAANVRVKLLVKDCMEAPLAEESSDDQNVFETQKKDRFSDMILPDTPCESNANTERMAQKEVDSYLVEPFDKVNYEVNGIFNLLRYWAQNADKYPNLSRVAFWVLSCPASFVQTADSYSINNWLVNCSIIHQKPDYVNKVLFIKTFKKM